MEFMEFSEIEMIEFNIEQGSLLNGGDGLSPTHKIVLKHGSETSIFWYLQEHNPCNPGDPSLDPSMAGQLFNQAQALLVGDFLYFSNGRGNDFHIHRLGSNRYTLKALR